MAWIKEGWMLFSYNIGEVPKYLEVYGKKYKKTDIGKWIKYTNSLLY